jgi:hypothetical protein
MLTENQFFVKGLPIEENQKQSGHKSWQLLRNELT